MQKKTYRALIILAVVVVLGSVVLAIGINYQNRSAETHQTEVQQSYVEEPPQQSTEPSLTSSQPAIPEGSLFEIHFFDVGEADSALVECDGHYMLINGGNPGSSRFLYAYLQQHGIDYLDYIVCSHAHADHVGGLAGAINYATVGTAYAPVT